ncbi:MAG: HlyD family secretion protein [Alphaproteobacteria bacterium]|nr:HlyD family secretion protein [Alphaproteobacteria bacterium]
MSVTPKAAGTAKAVTAPKRSGKKRHLLHAAIMLAIPVGLILGGGYVWLTSGRYESTENAYLQQPKLQISSEASGRLVDVNIINNQKVKAGDILFKVEARPYRIKLAQTDAALALARIKVVQLRAAYSQAKARQRAAVTELSYLKTRLYRQRDLARRGISSTAALDKAKRDLHKARQAKIAAGQAVISVLAALGGNPAIATDRHPGVLVARAARAQAAYNLGQTRVSAPANGVISQVASFKVGRYVVAGTPLFVLVETGNSWVEANFKETQIEHMVPGQTATVTFDTFPGHPVAATVESIGAGTGAEFSLLPAQNATGNWVKVTQRIPVRLRLNIVDGNILLAAGQRTGQRRTGQLRTGQLRTGQLRTGQLRTGMSATVSVDTGFHRTLSGLLNLVLQLE